ncbi:MAG: radical SAM protein [Desulfomonilaceae bacterium]|nr:radical SAM protein [Desulfomonilaceae bacterium]
MKIVLVRPPFYALFGVTAPKMKTYPLNLLCLATYLNRTERHVAAIVDGENISVPGLEPPEGAARDNPELVMNRGVDGMVEVLENPDHDLWRRIERSILAQEPDLVGITANSGNMDTVKRLVERLKPHKLPVILGGSHPTVLPEQSIVYTGADMVVTGEGEQALVDVMDSLQEGRGLGRIPSLAWKDDAAVTVNPRGELLLDIDGLPIPDRTLIDRSDYFGDVLITGRGCPFNCAYCASRNIWGKRVRFRSVPSIISELRLLRDQARKPLRMPGRWVVKVVDDTFTVHRKRTIELLDEIIAEDLNCFEYTGGVRADTLDEELVQKMRQANFRRVTLGVESGSPRILKSIHKGESNEDVKRAVNLLRQAGIGSHAFFMIGLPDETPEDIELSKALILDAQPDYVEINMVTPYPGTEIFDKLMPGDPLKIDRWYRWFHQGMATHSDRLGYDLDRAYRDFLDFAGQYHSSKDRQSPEERSV